MVGRGRRSLKSLSWFPISILLSRGSFVFPESGSFVSRSLSRPGLCRAAFRGAIQHALPSSVFSVNCWTDISAHRHQHVPPAFPPFPGAPRSSPLQLPPAWKAPPPAPSSSLSSETSSFPRLCPSPLPGVPVVSSPRRGRGRPDGEEPVPFTSSLVQ